MRTITDIVVHCSATPQSMDIGAKEIRQWHKEKGWSDIGYHYVLRRSGKREKGRPDAKMGAGVSGHNTHSLHVCLIGGTDAANKTKAEFNYTKKQMIGLDILLRLLTRKHKGARVLGHRDFPGVKKTCPNFDVPAWWYGG